MAKVNTIKKKKARKILKDIYTAPNFNLTLKSPEILTEHQIRREVNSNNNSVV